MLRRYCNSISIISSRLYYTVNSDAAKKDPDIIGKQIRQQIKATGPITVADYMKQVLTHPLGGYYMHRDVFGPSGDFVTSPELGQIFGEMCAIWFLNEWSKIGSPKPVQIVELGPGRGTLCQDILRVFDHFDSLKQASVHLVEISAALSDLQARRLCTNSEVIRDADSPFYRHGTSFQGVPVKWYRQLSDVPRAFTLLIAHEFFDALPIHKLQKTERGYREVLVDLDPENEQNLRYVISREDTPATKIFIEPGETREHLEISPDSLILMKDIALLLEEEGGLALIADYGHDGDGTDTFRAFKKHKQHDPLHEPGTADLTADVDFARLKKAATEEGRVLALGPTMQRDFLLKMGIEHRLKKLEQSVKEGQLEALRAGYDMMTSTDKMGSRFKFIALIPAVLETLQQRLPAVGFNT